MDACELSAYLVGACHGRHEANQTVLAAITRFHGDLAAAHDPAIGRRPNLRVLRGVVSDVGVITRARAIIGVRMPEPDWASRVSMLVESKLVRRKRGRGGVSILPNFIGIFVEREISREVECRWCGCKQAKEYDDDGDSPHTEPFQNSRIVAVFKNDLPNYASG